MSEKIKFETAMAELETIITKLENDDISLDDAIKLHQRGLELNNFCQKELEQAKMKIVEINKKDS